MISCSSVEFVGGSIVEFISLLDMMKKRGEGREKGGGEEEGKGGRSPDRDGRKEKERKGERGRSDCERVSIPQSGGILGQKSHARLKRDRRGQFTGLGKKVTLVYVGTGEKKFVYTTTEDIYS
uniref:Uncharacterized protein n=1 Tax=Pristionchus pacificus TaxID=54126 RepID=A0A2A6CTZ6_PRIPA|eukprot:PDM81704.1 hypothetical protein PRIPAC_30685 [Pristionchus pacificus]